MNRANTNFPTRIKSKLLELLGDATEENALKYYQLMAAEYMKLNVSKGIMLHYHMGMGKTLAAYHIIRSMMETDPNMNFIVMAPRALINNFKNSADKYEKLTSKKVDMGKVKFVKDSYTVEKQIGAEFNDLIKDDDIFGYDKKAKKALQLDNIDGYTIIIEESHLLSRKINNGSETMLRFYDLLMRSKCRIVMLSGSLIASEPFELVPIMNLLSGELLFPENPDQFYELFLDTETQKIKNKNKLQNRCFGLVSRIKPEHFKTQDLSAYPSELPTEVLRIEMEDEQYQQYRDFREEEIKNEKEKMFSANVSKNINRFKSSNPSKSGSYRVRSRQSSNGIISSDIYMMYKKGKVNQEDIIREVFKLPKKSLLTAKFKMTEKIIKKHNNSKGVIYTQYVGAGGASNIAAGLYHQGYTEINHEFKDLSFNDYVEGGSEPEDRKPNGKRFARVNGTLTEEEQLKIIDYYNSADNIYGEKLAIIIIGFAQTMGLDLKEVRYEIMYEPYWIYFIYDQFKHRMIRFGSHLRLPEDKRTAQMYVLISVHPNTVNIETLDDKMKKTTDEYIYDKMMLNKESLTSFIEAIEEIAIDCEIVKEFGTNYHTCRTCAPTNDSLYTRDKLVIKGIKYDIERDDPCKTGDPVDIQAKSIDVILDDKKTTYYYTPSEDNIYGFDVYIETGKDVYEEVPTSSPVYKIIKNQLNR